MQRKLLEGSGPILKSFYSTLKNFPRASTKMYDLFVTPSASSVTEPVHIKGEGFEPNSTLTIRNCMTCEQEEHLRFRSFAHLKTDQHGSFDMSRVAPLGGTYEGVHDMGLFWSMEKDNHDVHHLSNGLSRLKYNFDVFPGHKDTFEDDSDSLATAQCERYFGDEAIINREKVRSGRLRGTLFTPKDVKISPKMPAVITLYGGVVNKHVIEEGAALLANNGFVALALAYFGVEDLPRTYTSQPVEMEYFEEAIDFLASHHLVDKQRIGVYGGSKGGEIALGMMANLTKISSVAVVNACIASIAASTTYRGQTFPPITADLSKIIKRSDGTLVLREGLGDLEEEKHTIHRAEKSTADLLMIAGIDDWNWDSALMADVMKKRMDDVGKTNYLIKKYPGLGHNAYIGPSLPGHFVGPHVVVPKGQLVYYGGGDDKALHNRCVSESWNDVISFFKTTLGGNSK